MVTGLPRKLLYSALTTALVFTLVEVVLRVTTRELGKATIPSARVLQHVQAGDFAYDPLYGWVRTELPLPSEGIDQHGFRTTSPLEDGKPAGAWRAFTLGDSQTYGAGLRRDESYSAVAERALRAARPQREVQVVNTGTSGYGSLQALRLIRHRLPRWQPDLYVVDCYARDQPRDERVPVDPRFPTLDRLLFQWRTWYVLRYAVEESRGRLLGPRPVTDPAQRGEPWEHEGNHGNHDLIVEEAARQGVPLLFLDYPIWDMRRDRLECRARAALLPEGARVVDTCAALRASGRPLHELFFDDNHLTARGAELVGAALAEAVLAAGVGP